MPPSQKQSGAPLTFSGSVEGKGWLGHGLQVCFLLEDFVAAASCPYTDRRYAMGRKNYGETGGQGRACLIDISLWHGTVGLPHKNGSGAADIMHSYVVGMLPTV
jgi:hypothetical protein